MRRLRRGALLRDHASEDANISGADFSGADLRGAWLVGANLPGGSHRAEVRETVFGDNTAERRTN